jgi:hypothetical protein
MCNIGGHVEVQVSYKLAIRSYGWKNQRRPQFCTICLDFKRGCFEAVLDSICLRCLGVNSKKFVHYEQLSICSFLLTT